MRMLKLLLRSFFYGGFILFIGIQVLEAYNNAGDFNGFIVSNSLIPTEQIHQGGPPKDGIPAINKPVFISADQA